MVVEAVDQRAMASVVLERAAQLPKPNTKTPQWIPKFGHTRGAVNGQSSDQPLPCRNGDRLTTAGASKLACASRNLVVGERVQHRGLVGRRIHPGLNRTPIERSWNAVRSIAAAARSTGAVRVAVGSPISTAARLATAATVTAIGHSKQGPQAAAAGAASRKQNHNGESDETLHDRAFRDRVCVNRDQSGLKIAVEGEPVVEGRLTRSRTAPVQGTQSGASEVRPARRGFSRASERKIRRIRKKGQDEKSRCRRVFRQKTDTRL